MKNTLKSADWLVMLEYFLDVALLPTPAKFLQTFEQWEHAHRLRLGLQHLQRTGSLAKQGRGSHAACQLTPKGRLIADGGIDPVKRWSRAWDGQWRMLLFDLPARDRDRRMQLWRWLRANRFGYLQNSVWISPDPVGRNYLPLQRLKFVPETFMVVESHPAPPDSDATVVQGAWDWPQVNRRYQNVLELEKHGLELAADSSLRPVQLRQWLAAEREAWLTAIGSDPLLPNSLLPSGYLGREAHKQRQTTFGTLSRGMVKN